MRYTVPAHALGIVVLDEGEPGSAVWETETLPSAVGPSATICVDRPLCSGFEPVASPVVPPDGVGLGDASPPPPVVGQLADGTHAKRTSYDMPGSRISWLGSVDGSGSPVAASPAVWSTTLTLAGSAAPWARTETAPGASTEQFAWEMFVTRKEP